MSFCTKCGAYIPIGEKSCPACGAAQGEVHTGGTAAQTAPQNDTQDPRTPKQEPETGSYNASQTSGSYNASQTSGSYNASQTSGSYSAPKTEQQTYTAAKPEQSWEPWKQNGSGSQHSQYSASSGPDYGDKKLNVLSYVGPLFLVPLLLRKNDPFTRFHANQGLVLFLFELIIFKLFGGLIGAAGLVFSVFCLMTGARNVAQGIMAPLPLIGKIRLLK